MQQDTANNARESAGLKVHGPTPTVGRIVHYTNLGDKDGKYPPEIQAALITRVTPDGGVSLKVFYTSGIFDMPGPVPFTSAPAGTNDARGRWSWPPRT